MRRFTWRHLLSCAELLFVLYVAWTVLYDPEAGALPRLLVTNAMDSVQSLWALLHMDTIGTLSSAGLSAGKLLIAALPLLMLARRWRGWQRLRLLGLPFIYVLLPLVGTASLLPLVLLSGLSLWLIRFRWLRWTAVLPFALMLTSVPAHQFDFVWSRAALLQRCTENDGQRPINLQPEQIHPGYLGVTQLGPDEVLLPGVYHEPTVGGSWWLRRGARGWEIEGPSRVNYSFWPGCVMDGALWLARPNFMMSVRRDAATGLESVRTFPIPGEHIDFGYPVCDPEAQLAFTTEALSGSAVWQVAAKSGEVRRLLQEVGGLGAQGRRGPKGRLLFANSTHLVIYSREREEVIERIAAGVQMFGGFSLCPLNDEAALGDTLGRLRFFKPDSSGQYRFAGGISVPAPRDLAYSPDCQYVVVASWDDSTVYLIDRNLLRIIRTYRVGPALRGVTFLGPREFAVADACTMTSITF